MKIVVPVDFSDASLLATQIAVEIASRNPKIELDFLTFLEENDLYSRFTGLEPEETRRHLDILEAVQSRYDELWEACELDKTAARKYILKGELISGLLDFATNIEVKLFIMGSNGLGNPRSVFPGSNTQKLVRTSSIPVITTNENTRLTPVKRIAFLSDFEQSYQSAFSTLMDLQKHLHFESVELLNIDTPIYFTEIPSLIKGNMNKLREAYSFPIQSNQMEGKDIIQAVKSFCWDKSIDMLVVPTHGKRSMRSLFHKSIAESLMIELSIPVMSILLEDDQDHWMH